MKNITIILIAFFLFGSLLTNAQDDKDKKSGIRAGWQVSDFIKDGSKPDSASNYNSFYVGFFRDTKIIPMLHFGSGLEYFQNGSNYGDNSKRVLHTISVPLNLKFKIGPVFALAGVAGNFVVSEKLTLQGEDVSPEDYGGKTNWFDLPAYAGLGVKILVVTIEARYHWGLLEARDGYNIQYFQLGAGISF